MGKAFDDLGEGAAQRKWHEAWLTEAYRVLRPGGVIKAFNGTRTFHHMAYGSGFPKSTNIGKKLAQYEAAQASDPFWLESDADAAKGSERFRNWGTALKPSWEPVVVGRKPE
jgi:site-specific DNA-methyltransferase (adenine-specific)